MNVIQAAASVSIAVLLLPLILQVGARALAALHARRQPAPVPAPAAPPAGWPVDERLPSLPAADALVSATPLDVLAYVWRGAVLLRLGRYDDADADFRRARALDDRAVGAAFGLACSAARRDRNQIALAYLHEAVAIAPAAWGWAEREPLLAPLGARSGTGGRSQQRGGVQAA